MVDADKDVRVKGVVYSLIIQTIRNKGIVDNISGDIYISHEKLRRVLGESCRIHHSHQIHVIKELKDCDVFEICNPPICNNSTLKGGEIFYRIKKERLEE